MIQTLKSELKLRPTYDELIGIITSQGDPNRPSIETVIDRKATLFRNNQFGSQFDNVDFLGLKQQEEDKLRNEMRQHQLRQTAMNTGSSIGALSASAVSSPPLSYGGETPSDAYYRSADATPRMTLEQINTIQDEIRRHQQQQASSSLAEVAQHELPPSDVQQFSIATDELPPLEDIPQEEGEEEEEDFEDDEEVNDTQQIMQIFDNLKIQSSVKAGIKFDLNKMNLNDWSSISPRLMKRDTLMTMFKIAGEMGRLNEEQKEKVKAIENNLKATHQDTPEYTQAVDEARELFINTFHGDPAFLPTDDDDETQVPTQSRKHKETIDYNENISRWKQSDISIDDILFQLHLRGIQLTQEQEEEMEKLKIKGKGKSPTKKDYLLNYVERLIQTGKWTDEVNDQLLQKRKEDWAQMKKGKGKGVIRRAFESAGSTVLEAGKEAVKGAVIDSVVSGAMSLL